MWKKKKIVTDAIAPEEEVVVEVAKEKVCNGIVKVRITDQFVKYNWIHKRWDIIEIKKEVAQDAKRCIVL